jgi:hypothetical protein
LLLPDPFAGPGFRVLGFGSRVWDIANKSLDLQVHVLTNEAWVYTRVHTHAYTHTHTHRCDCSRAVRGVGV